MIEPPLIQSSRLSAPSPARNHEHDPHPSARTATTTTTHTQQNSAAARIHDRSVNSSPPPPRSGASHSSRPRRRVVPARLARILSPHTLVVLFLVFAALFSRQDGVAHALSVPTAHGQAAPDLRLPRAAELDHKASSADAAARRSSHPALNPARDVSSQSPINTNNNNNNPLLLLKRAGEATPTGAEGNNTCSCASGESLPIGEKVGFGVLMPLLVLLSGLFAGLTLGYMSLDETQLQVLAAQGTPKQRADAAKITSVTKDRHLLLTTLLIANMITNETLPVIADPLLGGGVQAVIVSTVLVIIFAELIPQSVCARYGLVVGAAMVWPTRIIIFVLYPIAWPVSRILHYLLGAHSGIVYRRAELKELVTMHAAENGKGGDLKGDTIMIVGGALDLQEKVVKDAMTPIDQVFMLPYSAKLDYPTLERIVRSGHSRIPIYQEFEVPVAARSGTATPSKKPSLLAGFARKASLGATRNGSATDLVPKLGAANSPRLGAADEKDAKTAVGPTMELVKRKKILGTLLVKSCVLLDPEDATPLSDMVINAIPTVPGDEPLLNVLNVFQEGRSHMAIVSSRSRRITADGVADVGSKSNMFKSAQGGAPRTDGLTDIDEEKQLEMVNSKDDTTTVAEQKSKEALEIEESFSGPDSPIGIITLEDVLEELIGEEIWDEYDTVNGRPADFARLSPPPSPDSKGRDPDMQLPSEHTTPVDAQDTNMAEKAAAEDQPTVVHTEQAQQQESAVGAATPKTVFQRLGLGRARSMRDSDGGSSEPRPSNIPSVAAVDSTSNPSRATLQVGSVQPPRSLSSRTGESLLVPSAAGAAPAEGNGNGPGVGSNASGSPMPPTSTSVRPVILRSTTASGQTSTTMAVLPETLLRGRRAGANETQPLPPGSVVQLGPLKQSGGAGAMAASSAAGGGPGSLFVPSPLLGATSGASTAGTATENATGTNSAVASGAGTPAQVAQGGGGGAAGGAARANRFKSTPVPRPAVRARSMGPGAVPATAGGGSNALEQSVASLGALSVGTAGEQSNSSSGAPLFIASPPAIEPETAPLDASIASLASLGNGRKDEDKPSSG